MLQLRDAAFCTAGMLTEVLDWVPTATRHVPATQSMLVFFCLLVVSCMYTRTLELLCTGPCVQVAQQLPLS